jgi:hypothetical protein
MEKHVTVVAALKIGFGVLGILFAAIVFVAVVGGGLYSGDSEVLAITGIIGSGVALFLLCLSVPQIIGGIGLLKWQPWARILVLILSIFDLLNFPFGTIVGIYTIWVLIQDETIQLFEHRSSQQIDVT